ncbi:class I adenylate-forming enzyme family protein [Prosthecobacter sp. SYSU 5D2]|uniref:class I adenylate-forming enzyme family protein n=1 Tax=Prosthecobacter sp. SYSU 5D2 TaxID=3134134 RepID=UPI0031FE6CFD
MTDELSSHLNLPCHWLAATANQWPDKLFISGSAPLTYGEAQRRVNALAAWMQKQGIVKGDRVVVVMPNRTEVLLISFAALQAGVIFSVLSHQIQPEGLTRILSQCEPKVLFTDAGTAKLGEDAAGSKTFCVDGPEWASLFVPDSATQPLPVSVSSEDIAFLVFTSGSTGTPRGVMLTQGNVAFVCPAILQRLGYRMEDCIGIFLPLAFDYSFYQAFYACLTGASLFLGRPEMVGPELPKILAREEVTVLPGVPSVFAALIKMQRYRPVDLPKLRMITNTGDHLPLAYIEQIQSLLPQIQVYPMFGLTECKRVSILLPEELEEHPESVGRPLDGTEVFTVDEAGTRHPPGVAGELVIQGPHLAAGYWLAPEETVRRYRDLEGVRTLFSGDQGSVDSLGYITFHSRSDFVIKHRGTRLSPAEVEEAACAIPQVIAAGCVKDDTRDLLFLFVASTEEGMTEAGVLTGLSARLERGKLPDRVIFLAELPRTGNQKLDRKALRNLLTTV